MNIEYDKQPLKYLSKLDKQASTRIIDKIENILSTDLVPSDAKKIIGEQGVFRLRIGGFRVLYRLNYLDNKIVIFKIDKRERVY